MPDLALAWCRAATARTTVCDALPRVNARRPCEIRFYTEWPKETSPSSGLLNGRYRLR